MSEIGYDIDAIEQNRQKVEQDYGNWFSTIASKVVFGIPIGNTVTWEYQSEGSKVVIERHEDRLVIGYTVDHETPFQRTYIDIEGMAASAMYNILVNELHILFKI